MVSRSFFNGIRLVLLLFILIGSAVGIAIHQLEVTDEAAQQNSAATKAFLSLWEYRGSDGILHKMSAVSPDDGCNAVTHRLAIAAGTGVTAVILYGFMLIAAIVEMVLTQTTGVKGKNRRHRRVKMDLAAVKFAYGLMHGVSSVLMLITWALVVNIYSQSFCGGLFDFKNGGVVSPSSSSVILSPPPKMAIAPGLALLISVWCVQLVLITLVRMCTMKPSSSSSADASASADDVSAMKKRPTTSLTDSEGSNDDDDADLVK